MSEVEIKLTEGQYRTLTRVLYFVDWIASNGLLSDYKDGDPRRNELAESITRIYSCGKQLGLPESISLASFADRLPFSDDELSACNKQHWIDLRNIGILSLANELAKRDLRRTEAYKKNYDGTLQDEIVRFGRSLYLEELEKNGIANVKFKILSRLKMWLRSFVT